MKGAYRLLCPAFFCAAFLLFAREAFRSGDYVYIIQKTGVELTRYVGSGVSLDVPRKFSGVSLTVIGRGAFAGCVSLESVSLPSSVVRIMDGAFAGCSALRVVHIPSSVSYLGENVFPAGALLLAKPGSAAQRYADRHGISWQEPPLADAPAV